MKSCEDYVVARLERLDDKCQKLEDTNRVLTTSLDRANAKLMALKELLLKHASYRTSSLNTRYIDIDTFWDRSWQKDERTDFQFMSDFLGVNIEDFEPYKAPVIENVEEKENEDGTEE